jgi:hypothetical protein
MRVVVVADTMAVVVVDMAVAVAGRHTQQT